MYTWIVFLHVLGVFGFLLAHGVSVAVAFAFRRERNPEKISALLSLSLNSIGFLNSSILVLLLTGIIGGFMGHWWGKGWIWLSLGLLLAISGYMAVSVTGYYHQVRKAIGVEYKVKNKPFPPVEPVSVEELDALLDQSRPVVLAIIGLGGLAFITWLMLFKPF
jgi:hypothetical protein